MTSAVAIVSALYDRPRMFDEKAFEKDLEKHLKKFFKTNCKGSFATFVQRVGNVELLEAILGALTAPELRSILKEIDAAWLKPNVPVAQLRRHALAISTGEAKPTSDISLRAKAKLAALKAAKTIEDLRAFHKQTNEDEVSRATVALLPPASRRTAAKRFDKFNSALPDMSDADLLQHLFDLASSRREPAPKTIASAAAKAKWSGKEPD